MNMDRRILTAMLLLLSLDRASFDHIATSSIHDQYGTMNSTEMAYNDTVDTCNGLNPLDLVQKLNDHEMEKDLVFPSDLNRECYCFYSSKTKLPSPGYGRPICPVLCFWCDKVYPRCLVQNVCCPDPEANHTESQFFEDDNRSVCLQIKRERSYYVHRSCPDDYDDVITRTLCEEDLAAENITLETSLVVSDNKTGVTYFNSYCAKCNNVQSVQHWTLQILCHTSLFMVGVTTQSEYIAKIALGGTDCWIRQHPPPSGVNPFLCNPRINDRNASVVSSCNVTGQEMYKTGVEDQCIDEPFQIRRRVIHGRYMYKNIFCLICNSELTKRQGRWDCFDFVGVDRAPFKFLFGFDQIGFQPRNADFNDDHDSNMCRSNEWMDPQGTCRQAVCAKGKIPNNKTECVTSLAKYILGLPYRMGLLLVPEAGHSEYGDIDIKDMSELVVKEMKNLLAPAAFKLELQTALLFNQEMVKTSSHVVEDKNSNKNIGHQVSTTIQSIWMKLFIIGSKLESRDFTERTIINTFNESFIVPINGSRFVSFKVRFVDDLSFNVDSSCENVPNTTSCHISVNTYLKTQTGDFAETRVPVSILNTVKSDYIEIRPYLSCLHVELYNEEVEETMDFLPVPHVTKIILRFGKFNFELTDPREINQISHHENGSFCVCKEFLESITSGWSLRFEGTDVFNTIQYVLTVLCVSASLLCLFATVITYCLFPNLRNVAGWNTMGLSMSLMVAQIILFVANVIHGPSNLCTAIGVITHYAWLVMFSWMFICCLHILKVFTGIQSRSQNPHHDKKVIRTNLMTSLLVPAFIVLVVMGIYFTMYDGKRLGYGYKACAMDSPFAIHGPLIFVITCNAIFFFVVVFKIWGVRRLQGNMEIRKEDRKDFVVYMKLSTLTGMFWLLVILGEVFYNDVIRCLAVIFNGCQGAFIFASFTANTRVLKQYQEKFKLN